MDAATTAVRIVGVGVAAFLVLVAIGGFATGSPWIGLFMLILAGTCVYWALLRRRVAEARSRRIANLQMAARAEAAHAALMSGRPVSPRPVPEPPRRG